MIPTKDLARLSLVGALLVTALATAPVATAATADNPSIALMASTPPTDASHRLGSDTAPAGRVAGSYTRGDLTGVPHYHDSGTDTEYYYDSSTDTVYYPDSSAVGPSSAAARPSYETGLTAGVTTSTVGDRALAVREATSPDPVTAGAGGSPGSSERLRQANLATDATVDDAASDRDHAWKGHVAGNGGLSSDEAGSALAVAPANVRSPVVFPDVLAGFVLGSVLSVVMFRWHRVRPAIERSPPVRSALRLRSLRDVAVALEPSDGVAVDDIEDESSDGDGDPRPDEGDGERGAEQRAAEEQSVTDEVVVQRLLDSHGGRLKQKSIVEATDWSKAKVSRLLSSMADEGTVVKVGIGRENLICLDGHVPEIARTSDPAPGNGAPTPRPAAPPG